MEVILLGFLVFVIVCFILDQIFDFAMSKLEKRDHKDIYPLTKQEEIQIKRQRNLDKLIK